MAESIYRSSIRVIGDAKTGGPANPSLLKEPGDVLVAACDLPWCRYKGEELLTILCPCGCGQVYEAHYASNGAPDGVHGWSIVRETDGTITVRKHPENRGGGSGSLWAPCGAHYFIRQNRVIPETDS